MRRIRVTERREKVNHAVAERKKWAKFGLEKNNPPGPDLATTTVGEDVPMRLEFGFNVNKEQPQMKIDDAVKEKLKAATIKCRTCAGAHWTSKCPYKDTLGTVEDLSATPESVRTGTSGSALDRIAAGSDGKGSSGRYVPPALRGASRDVSTSGGDSYQRERNDEATLRVTNLSEYVTEDELRQLFRNFGLIQRVYIARDRETNLAKGFAFINFFDRDAAQRAQKKIDGFGMHNLIMRCEFSKRKE